MALHHIVTWKLSGETLADRDAQAEKMTELLHGLVGKVPSLRAIALYRNSLFEGENWDLTLVAQFDDAEGLAAYADHPDHQAVLAATKGFTTQRVAVDAEV
ncbi:MAG: Dabb family protein [Candidatus Leucobacter sulfamidivorax]|nr:Dabb family protein [Candidatus Leucobacter sulfamidivorax]